MWAGLWRSLLPAFVLTSVVIGGGYATGREFAEFFLRRGPWEGLIGIALAALIFAGVYAASLEFARRHRAFEYRAFFRALLGPFWPAFEVVYLAMTLLTLSVFAAICSAVLSENLGWSPWAGAALFMAASAGLAALGVTVLERYIFWKTVLLFVFYGIFVALCLAAFGDQSATVFAEAPLKTLPSAFVGGLTYAGYNLSAMVATLFCARRLEGPAEALRSGLLGGLLAMTPGALFYLAMTAFYPDVVSVTVPIDLLLDQLRQPIFKALFLAVLTATLVGTGGALLHAVNERVAAARQERGQPTPWRLRALLASAIMVISVVVAAKVGLTDLVAKGYGLITFAFIALYAVPISVWGVRELIRQSSERGVGSIRGGVGRF